VAEERTQKERQSDTTGEPSSDDLINHFGFYAREYSRISIQFPGGDQEEIALRRMDDAEKALRSRLASVERATLVIP
jgi:hypothetical protein